MKCDLTRKRRSARNEFYALLALLVLATPGYGQDSLDFQEASIIESKTVPNETPTKGKELVSQTLDPPGIPSDHNPALQISSFVRRIFQDAKGNLWFGTNGDGVCRYDGKSLTFFSSREGLSGTAIRGIVEDKDGNLWFGTNGGVSKYNGESFVNFTVNEGLSNNDVWSVYLDRAGTIWVGTWGGACRFDAKAGGFTPFPLPPAPELDTLRGVTSLRIVHAITEDREGNMWFAVGAGGVYKYDGKSLTNISEKDGLCNNSVNSILEDAHGNIWFATHHNGISRYDGKSFTNFTANGVISGDEVWSLYEDKSGNIWFPAEGFGVYRYDGESFTNFHNQEGLYSNAIQCIFEDKEGRLWCGGWLGLFRYDGESFFQVTREGPWE